MTQTTAVIILAAGKGTRMKSQKAKVLHELASRPMILYVVDAATRVAGRNVIVVVGTEAEKVKKLVSSHANLLYAYQEQQLGTGHAVICALPKLPDPARHIVILCGDVPLIRPETLQGLVKAHAEAGASVTVLAARVDNPYGYGRLKCDGAGTIERIVEEADATEAEKQINIVNTGIYCVERAFLEDALFQITPDNAQKEIYLTDIIAIATEAQKRVGLVMCQDNNEMQGINTIKDLQMVEAILADK